MLPMANSPFDLGSHDAWNLVSQRPVWLLWGKAWVANTCQERGVRWYGDNPNGRVSYDKITRGDNNILTIEKMKSDNLLY